MTEGRSRCHSLGIRDTGWRLEGGSPLQRAGGAQQCHRSPGAHGGVCWVGRGALPLPHPLPVQPGAPKTDLFNGVCFKLIIRTPLALEFDNWPNDLGEFAASRSISISINQSTAGIESAFVPGLLPAPRVTFSFCCRYLIAAGQISPYPLGNTARSPPREAGAGAARTPLGAKDLVLSCSSGVPHHTPWARKTSQPR